MHRVAWFFSGLSFFVYGSRYPDKRLIAFVSRLSVSMVGYAVRMRPNTFNFHKIGLLLWKSNWRCLFPSFSLVWSFFASFNVCSTLLLFISLVFMIEPGLVGPFLRFNWHFYEDQCGNLPKSRPLLYTFIQANSLHYLAIWMFQILDFNQVRFIRLQYCATLRYECLALRWSRTSKWGKIHILSRLSCVHLWRWLAGQ